MFVRPILLTLVVLTSLAGCVQVGTRFDESKVNELQPGVSTIADAETKLGQPTAQSATGDGNTLFQWQFVYGTGIGGGGGAHVGILFGPDRKMIRVVLESATGTEQGSFGTQPLPGNRSTLGITANYVTPALAESAKMGRARGFVIVKVEPASPAAKAGLVQGDIVLAYGGKPIASSSEWLAAIGAHGPEDEITIWRAGKEQTVIIKY